MSPVKVVWSLLLLNLGLMSLIAIRSQRHNEKTCGQRDLPMSNLRLLSTYLPKRWKIWFLFSNVAGLIIVLIITLSSK